MSIFVLVKNILVCAAQNQGILMAGPLMRSAVHIFRIGYHQGQRVVLGKELFTQHLAICNVPQGQSSPRSTWASSPS